MFGLLDLLTFGRVSDAEAKHAAKVATSRAERALLESMGKSVWRPEPTLPAEFTGAARCSYCGGRRTLARSCPGCGAS